MAVMIAVTTALYSILIGTETIRLKWTLDEDQKKKRLRFLLILGIVMLMLAAIKLIFFFFNGEKRNMILALMSIVNGIIFILLGTGIIKADWTVAEKKKKRIQIFLFIVGILMIVITIAIFFRSHL